LKQQNNRSIKADLLVWLLPPLLSMCLASSVVAYYLASYFANDSYDRNLINTAGSVAARVRIGTNSVADLDLPPAALAILQHTYPNDKFYYQVLNSDFTRLAGDALPSVRLDSSIPYLSYVKFNGETLRVAQIRMPIHDYPDKIIFVQAAETLNSRLDLTNHILFSILVPQILLLLFVIFAVSFGVKKGLKSLADLRNALSDRSRSDLKPLNESIAPLESQSLVSAINELLGRLKADLDAQQRFVANAAHQLQTPLAGIQTYVEIVERQSTDNSRNLLRQINKGIDRMSHLIKQLLVLAKSEPQNNLSFEEVDLNTIASEVGSELVDIALKKNIEVVFDEPTKPVIVYGDVVSLKELITNLLDNAILYTDYNGTVSVKISSDNVGVQLTVEDNGPGIPEEEREKVFERFYRILGTQVEGSGLGLAIVKEIAAAHHAEVLLTTPSTGKGTVVIVKFPAKKPK
jgi:two-component system sensor histidine kinase TctE